MFIVIHTLRVVSSTVLKVLFDHSPKEERRGSQAKELFSESVRVNL